MNLRNQSLIMQVSVYRHNATDMSPKTLFWEWFIVLFGLCWWYLPTTGELYKTIRGYKAAEEDELTLEAGEMIEVIHKLLDGWWVVRYESTNFNFMVCWNNRNACSYLMIHNWIRFPNNWKKCLMQERRRYRLLPVHVPVQDGREERGGCWEGCGQKSNTTTQKVQQ